MAIASYYYIHTRQGNAPWALSGDFQVEDLDEADKRAETKRGIITRSFPAVWLEGPPKCDQVFPTRADRGSQSVRFAIHLVRAGRVGIILALCASKMPVGNTSRPSKHPWTNRSAATECVINLIPLLKFDQFTDLSAVLV